MGLIESQAIDRAFRSGLMTDPDAGPEPVGPPGYGGMREDGLVGAGEASIMRTVRMPGLASADTAFETGRTLRLIARLFDSAGAPPRVTEQFRDNLAAAVMGEAMRSHSTWTRSDTIDMFVDMYERILAPDADELKRTRNYLEERVTKPAKRPGLRARVGGWLRKP